MISQLGLLFIIESYLKVKNKEIASFRKNWF